MVTALTFFPDSIQSSSSTSMSERPLPNLPRLYLAMFAFRSACGKRRTETNAYTVVLFKTECMNDYEGYEQRPRYET